MICGIVVAKQNSNRFPNKNIFKYKKYPLFWHSVLPLLESDKVDKVYVSTDSLYIKEYCEKRGVSILWRGPNINSDNDPIFKVIKFAYQSMDHKSNICVSIMANCPGHTPSDVENSINILIKNDLNEVRSFDKNNIENGIIVFNTRIFDTYDKISSYVGGVFTSGKEIHFKRELDDI